MKFYLNDSLKTVSDNDGKYKFDITSATTYENKISMKYNDEVREQYDYHLAKGSCTMNTILDTSQLILNCKGGGIPPRPLINLILGEYGKFKKNSNKWDNEATVGALHSLWNGLRNNPNARVLIVITDNNKSEILFRKRLHVFYNLAHQNGIDLDRLEFKNENKSEKPCHGSIEIFPLNY